MRRKDEILHDIQCCMAMECDRCILREEPGLSSCSYEQCGKVLYNELTNLISSLEKSSSCTFGENVTVKLDGIHELSPHPLKLSQRLKNVTVEILECPKCGETSVGWYRQANTEEID